MPARNDRQRENDWDAARRKTRLGTNEAWKRWLKTASSRRTPPGTSNDSRLQAVISDYASPSTDFHPFHHFLSTMAPREAINIGNWVDFRWASKCRPADANIRTVSSLKISTSTFAVLKPNDSFFISGQQLRKFDENNLTLVQNFCDERLR